MNENSSAKVNTIHMKEKFTFWHRDKFCW